MEDSALIRAFDDAVSKYKVMHGMVQLDYPKEESDLLGTIESVDSLSKDLRGLEVGQESKSIPNNTKHLSESPPELFNSEESDTNIEDKVGKDSVIAQGETDSNEKFVGSYEEQDPYYQELLTQYNEIETQRQQVLHLLYQSNYYNNLLAENDPAPTISYDSGCCSSLLNPPEGQGFQPWTNSSCCSDVVPATKENMSTALEDKKACSFNADVVSIGVGAAEKAPASIKMKVLEAAKVGEADVGKASSSMTDLSELLNAWYSTGFLTGKYLAEQSSNRK